MHLTMKNKTELLSVRIWYPMCYGYI